MILPAVPEPIYGHFMFFFSTGFVPVWTDYRESKPVYTKTHTIPINRSPYKLLFRRLRSHVDAHISSLVRDPGVRGKLFAVNVLIT